MFGEDALFGGGERTTVATCMEETLICKAHADDLFALCPGTPALRAQRRRRSLNDRLSDASATIEDLAYAKISDRLVNLFERLATEHGRTTGEGTLLDLRLTHQDIASIIGSTRETVSLELNQLVRARPNQTRGRLHHRSPSEVMLTDNAFFSGVEAASLVRVLPAFRLATFPPGATLYVRGRAARLGVPHPPAAAWQSSSTPVACAPRLPRSARATLPVRARCSSRHTIPGRPCAGKKRRSRSPTAICCWPR